MKRVLDHIIEDLKNDFLVVLQTRLIKEKNQTTEEQPDQDILRWNESIDYLLQVIEDGIPEDLCNTTGPAEEAAWHMNSQLELAMMHLKKYLLA